MAYLRKVNKEERRDRKDIVYGAKQHIKSLLVGLKRFKEGSDVEVGYIEEHFLKLQYYIKKVRELSKW